MWPTNVYRGVLSFFAIEKGKIVYAVGKPCDIYRLQKKLMCPCNHLQCTSTFSKALQTDSCLWLVNPWSWISTRRSLTSCIHRVLKVSNLFPEQEIQTFGPPPQEDTRHQESSYSPWKEPQDPEDAQKNEGLPTKKVCRQGLNLFLSCVWSQINSVKKIE